MEILHTESADGTRLRLVRWGSGEKNILLVHGLAEHLGRYGHVAEPMAQAGWRVTGVELRGHGHSEGRRGHVGRWRRYVEDLQAGAAVAGAGGGPLVVVAHSMGGLVALSALIEPIHPAVQAVAISNPLLKAAVQVPALKLKAARVLSRLLPWVPMPNELDANDISRDPEVVRAYRADDLVFSTISPRWATEMLKAQERVIAHAPQYRVPLRVMVGTGDRICDHRATLQVADRWGGPVSEAIYPGLFHELFNEPEKEQVIAELIAWLGALELS